MQNQENSEKKKLTKSEYNRLYYQKNKEKIGKSKSNQTRTNVFHLFSRATPSSPSHSERWIRMIKCLEVLLLLILIGAITFFLIREAASFYLDEHESSISAYLKAGIIEAVAVLFSFGRSNNLFLRWSQRIAVVLLCSFTLFIMSGKLVKTAVSSTSRVESVRQTLGQLESELKQKEQLRNEFLNRGRLTMTRQYEKGIDQIRDRLITTRDQLCSLQTPEIISNGLKILIGFRLLLVITNLICIHLLAEHLTKECSPKRGQVMGQLVEFP